jgi:hypothetical protein
LFTEEYSKREEHSKRKKLTEVPDVEKALEPEVQGGGFDH